MTDNIVNVLIRSNTKCYTTDIMLSPTEPLAKHTCSRHVNMNTKCIRPHQMNLHVTHKTVLISPNIKS